MASKKSKKSVKSVAIDTPSFDSKIDDGDLILVNRNKKDLHTDVEDLAQYIGEELELDQLVTDINKEIGDVVANIGNDLSQLEVKVDSNKGEIDGHSDELSDLSDQVEQNKNDIAGNKGDIAGNTSKINTNTGNIAGNASDISALQAEDARQNSWTGIANGTNSDSNATLNARITSNTVEIDKLKGALVYRGVGDFSSQCPYTTSGDFVLSTQTGNVSGSGWTGLSAVEDEHYYAFNGSNWEEAGAHGVVLPEVNDGALVIQPKGTASGLTVTGGTGFSANSKGSVTTELKIDLNNEGGLELTDDGIGINAGDGIVVDGGGIAVDPGYISSHAGAKDGSLTIAAGSEGIAIKNGTGFSANTDSDVTTEVSLDLNDEGGLEITGDGLGIAPKPNSGIIVDDDGISVDENFVQGIAGPVPALQAVTNQGATTNKKITVAGVVSTADQSESTFLHKDISQLPELS